MQCIIGSATKMANNTKQHSNNRLLGCFIAEKSK